MKTRDTSWLSFRPIKWKRKGDKKHERAHVNGYVLDVWHCETDGPRWRVTKLIGVAAGRARTIRQAKRRAPGKAQTLFP